jgi:hypothetical protein
VITGATEATSAFDSDSQNTLVALGNEYALSLENRLLVYRTKVDPLFLGRCHTNRQGK